MSPWGRFYLERLEYHADWWAPFESWRMCGFIDHVFANWPDQWRRVSRHLDEVERHLRTRELSR